MSKFGQRSNNNFTGLTGRDNFIIINYFKIYGFVDMLPAIRALIGNFI